MSNRRGVVRNMLVVAGIACGWALAPLPEAQAQQTVRIRASSPMGGAGAAQISRRSMERYGELLGLTAEQRESAMAVHEGYAATYDQARKAQREAMEELRRTADDSGDQSVFMEKMPGIQKSFRETTQKAEQSLMGDMKSLLTPQQEARWAAVERMRRRETTLRGGAMSGEAMDLVDVVYGLKLTGEPAAAVGTALDEYELEMDRLLLAKEAKAKDAPQWEPGKPIDIEAMQKGMEEARESGKKIVDLNTRTAEKVKAMLPDDVKDKFAEDVKRRSFPRVYRPSRVTRGLEAAMGMSDLDGTQRDSLKELKDSYERDAAAINARWADAIRESEQKGDEGGMAGVGGGQVFMAMGDEPQALKDARTARRELDERASDRLKSILKPEQRERLPKAPPPGAEEDGEGGGAMMIMSTEVRGEPR